MHFIGVKIHVSELEKDTMHADVISFDKKPE